MRIISLGFNRDLWDSNSADDTLERFRDYGSRINRYSIIVHSLKRQGLCPLKVGSNISVYPTNGHSSVHSWLRMVLLAVRIARRYGADLIQAQDPLFTGSAARVVSAMVCTPYNICVYGTNPYEPQWRKERWVHRLGSYSAKRVLSAAHGIQVDGSRTKASLIESGLAPERITLKPVIPANIEAFFGTSTDPELRHTLSLNGRFSWLVLFVARFVRQKHPRILVSIAEKLQNIAPQVRLICVGDGPERASVERSARSAGLADRILCVGTQPQHRLVRYMAACDSFILTSNYEGFARVLMMAAAAAKPIVTTNVSGADDAVIDNHTGYIVPVNDAQALAASCLKLVSNPNHAKIMGLAGQQHMREMVAALRSSDLQIDIWRKAISLWSNKRKMSSSI